MKEKKKEKSNKRKWLYGLLIIVLLLMICDPRLKTVKYSFESTKIETPIKVALLTDLHGSWYGKEQRELITAIDREEPDVVLLGGDIFDDHVSYRESEETIAILSQKYKCYYVTGNHEFWSEDVGNIWNIIRSYGVTILSGETDVIDMIEIKGQLINICGVDDPYGGAYSDRILPIEKQLQQIEEQRNKDCYSILLSHRPEYYELYSKYKHDLVLSGHAHGGQWRLPGILNGLYAPNQGLFPKYAGGLYEYEGGTLVVSRGLDRWGIKFPRIFNRPELVILEIKGK